MEKGKWRNGERRRGKERERKRRRRRRKNKREILWRKGSREI